MKAARNKRAQAPLPSYFGKYGDDDGDDDSSDDDSSDGPDYDPNDANSGASSYDDDCVSEPESLGENQVCRNGGLSPSKWSDRGGDANASGGLSPIP